MPGNRAAHPGRQVGRQGRLFAPLGMHKGSPAAFEPENWLAGGRGQTIAWHATADKALPAFDAPMRSPHIKQRESDYDDDYVDGEDTTDSEGRPMTTMGSAIGLHFGSQKAAIERGGTVFSDDQRDWVHPVALNDRQMEWIGEGPTRRPWSDNSANYEEGLTDKVEDHKIVPYHNEMEDRGSISYRARPEAVQTWGEQVLEAGQQHHGMAARWGRSPGNQGLPRPSAGQVAAAREGFNPVVPLTANRKVSDRYEAPAQQSMFDTETYDNENMKYVGHHVGSLSFEQKNAISANSWLTTERPNDRGFMPDEARHAALSQVQFRQTGLRMEGR